MSGFVLDTVANKIPIGAEVRGLVRDFCHRVGREARLLDDQAIGAPPRRRIARYPDRRPRASAGDRSRMWIGSHALARWFQRSGSRSDERLLQDLGDGAATDASDRAAFPDVDDVRVPINATEAWWGSMMLAPEDDGDNLVFHAKTFF